MISLHRVWMPLRQIVPSLTYGVVQNAHATVRFANTSGLLDAVACACKCCTIAFERLGRYGRRQPFCVTDGRWAGLNVL